jgi:hypothetical protein
VSSFSRVRYGVAAGVLALGLTGQAPPPASTSAAPAFDAHQYARFMKPGKGRIDGSFTLRIGNADARPQAGAKVECLPDLAYTEWALASTANAINQSSDTSQSGTPQAEDPQLAPYTRITKTDSNGSFHFYHLPYGRYVMRVSLITAFARTVQNQNQAAAGAVILVQPQTGGITVYDYSHAYFDSKPVYVGSRPPFPPIFGLVARHNTFDPRR